MAAASHQKYRRGSDSDDDSADIFDAIKKGNKNAVESFLKPNGNINVDEKEGGNALLHVAVKENRKNIVELLLEKGADINALNDNGNTPLHIAIKKGNKENTELFLEKNKDGTFKWKINENNRNRALYLVDNTPSTSSNKSWQYIKALLDLSGPGSSGVKRPSDTTGSGSDGKKPKVDVDAGGFKKQGADQDGNPPKRPRTDQSYTASGVKRALDGTIYQSKLLGLFTKRGIDKKYDFLLATEMDAAEKFDDVVFKFQAHSKWIYRFFQAKHKQDAKNSKLTVNDLISTSNDNPFSLQKYLVSFCKIKDNNIFEGADFKDFVIITNTDFDFSKNLESKKDGDPTKRAQEHNELINKWKGFFEKEEDLKEDAILYFGNKDFKAEKSKFNNNAKTDLAEIIKFSLLKSALEAKEIEYLSSVKEKLEAVEVCHQKDLITRAKDAAKNIEKESNGKKRKGEVLKEVKEVLKLKAKIIEENRYTDLENGIKELDKTSAKDKKNQAQLDKAIKDVLDEANKISDEANNKLNEAKSKLYDYDNATIKATRLCEDKRKLNDTENDLRKIKDKISEPITTLNDIKDIIKEDLLKRRIPKTTLADIQKKTNSDLEEVKETLDKRLGEAISEISVIRVALNDDTLDNYLKEFLEKFRFVTNYPNEKELGLLIKNELGEEFHLLNADLVGDSFEREMLDFLKSYDKGKANFYSWSDGEKFFKALRGKINTLMTSGLSKSYPEKLRAYEVDFENNLEGLKGFLWGPNQILHLVTKGTRLSAIKILQSLKNPDLQKTHSYLAKKDGYIFMRLRTLLRQETQKYATDAFEKKGTHDLLVIECQTKNQGKLAEIGKLCTRLSGALHWNSSKKIILISPEGDLLAEKFKDSQKGKYQREDDQNAFKDLDSKSQDKVLERKVNFQGKDLSLNAIIDKESAGEIIDQASLSRLFEEEKIAIGDQKAFSSIGYVKDFYIPRALHRQRIKAAVLKEKIGTELFFITGANEESLSKLGAKKADIQIWEDGKTYDKGIILPSSDDKNHKELFQKLSEKRSGKNMHWLEHQAGKLAWRATKGGLTALDEYIDKDDIPDVKNALKEGDFSKPEALGDKVVIVANDPGVGKSTILTSIARKMKGLDDNNIDGSDDVWIVRFDLNDYAINKEKLRDHDRRKNTKSLTEISFDEDNINSAIDFVSEIAVPAVGKDFHTQFQRKFFKAHLEKTVILFDGFDEISPTYKEKTHILLKALKRSHLAQLWVTTRVHEKAHLEEQLESPAYILSDLTEGEQKEFLNKFWRWSLKQKSQNAHEKVCDLCESKQKNEKSQEETIRQYLKQLKQDIEMLLGSLSDTPIQDFKKRISETLQEHPDHEEQAIDRLESLQKAIDEKDEDGKYKLSFSSYAEELLRIWNASIKHMEKAFTNVPLNLRMLAEVVFEKKFQLPENLGLLGLYEEFINIKLDIYKEEKAKAIQGNQAADIVYLVYSEKLDKIHCELALEEIFKEEELSSIVDSLWGRRKMKKFKKLLHRHEKDEKTEIQRAGLMSFLSDGSPRFIHRSFAEYFLSEHFARNLQNAQVQKLLLEKILLEDDYTLIRKFFNCRLEMLFKYKSRKDQLVQKISSDGDLEDLEDLEKRYPTYLELEQCLRNIELKIDVKKSVMDVESYYKETILHIACREDHTPIIKLLFLLLNKSTDSKIRNELVVATDRNGRTALQLAAYFGKSGTLSALLDYLSGNTNILQEEILKYNNDGKTVLFFAFEGRRHEIIQVLLKRIKEHEETLKKLMLAIYKGGKTILHYASASGDDKAVYALLKGLEDHADILKKLVLAIDEDGKTALHLAVCRLHYETVVSLLVERKDYSDTLHKLMLATDNDGKTALLLAAEKKSSKIIQVMLQSVDKAIFKDLVIVTVYKKDQTDLEETIDKLISAIADNIEVKEIKGRLAQVKEKRGSLDKAINSGDINEVQKILGESDTDFKELMLATDDAKRTFLDLAIENNKSEVLSHLLNKIIHYPNLLMPLVLGIDEDKKNILHRATEEGRTETLRTLLENIKDTDILNTLVLAIDRRKLTALHFAITKGYEKIVEFLLSFVKNHLEEKYPGVLQELLLEPDNGRKIALHVAAREGHTETLKVLLNFVKENLPHILTVLVLEANNEGETSLHVAAKEGHTETLKAMLKFIKENVPEILEELVLKCDMGGHTPLHGAAEEGHTQTLEVLLNVVKENLPYSILKELVLKADNEGEITLHGAAKEGHTETLKTLLEWVNKNLGKDFLQGLVLKTNKAGRTIVHRTAKIGNNETVTALLDFVRDNLDKDHPGTLKELVLKRDNKRLTALHLTVIEVDGEAVELLLDFVKDNIDKYHPGTLKELLLATDKNGNTALHWTVALSDIEILQALLDWVKNNLNNEDPSNTTLTELILKGEKDGRSALHEAAKIGDIEIALVLLNKVNEHFNEKNNTEMLKELAFAKDKYGQTFLHLAYWYNQTEFIDDFLCEAKVQYEIIHKKLTHIKDELDRIKKEKDVLDGAIQHGNNIELQKVLDNNNQIIRELTLATDKNGNTSLHLAVEKGDSNIVKALLNSLKDHPKILKDLVLKQNDIDHTALYKALWNVNEEIVEVLLESLRGLPNVLKDLLLLLPNDSGETLMDFVLKVSTFKRTTKGLLNNNVGHRQPVSRSYKKIANILKAQYEEIAFSLLDSETNVADFTNDQLEILRTYVGSDSYTKENKEEILEKINTELEVSEERSFELNVRGDAEVETESVNSIRPT